MDKFIDTMEQDWALVTAVKKDGSVNCCTVSWGGIGRLWNKKVITVYIKPIRYTDEFMDEAEYFTVSFFDKKYQSSLLTCGRKSGRDCNKIKEANLTLKKYDNNAASFEEANHIYILKKIYKGQIKKDNMIDLQEVINRYYLDEPYHNVYIGEISEEIKK